MSLTEVADKLIFCFEVLSRIYKPVASAAPYFGIKKKFLNYFLILIFYNKDADLLAMHATNLKILNLSRTSITETGLTKLFLPALNAEDDQLLPVGFGKCGQVEVLDISGIGI
jgi:hypothetical protein